MDWSSFLVGVGASLASAFVLAIAYSAGRQSKAPADATRVEA